MKVQVQDQELSFQMNEQGRHLKVTPVMDMFENIKKPITDVQSKLRNR